MIAQFQGRIAELEQLKLAADATPRSKEQSRNRAGIKLTWREGKKAPRKMYCSLCSAEDSNILYIKIGIKVVYAFTISTSMWSQLPDCPVIYNCPLVIISNLLTLVVVIQVMIESIPVIGCSVSLGRTVLGDGLRNFHACQQNNVDQLYCALEQL